MVEVSLTVGKLDASLALLLTKEHHLIEFPTVLLPSDVEAGSIVKISCERDKAMEKKNTQLFESVQDKILSSFGTNFPQTPVLRVKNVTQTSVVLEWDPIDPATSDIISLTLYKNGTRFGAIPTPLKRTATKLSGLSIDTAYSFYLELTTTGGSFTSNEVNLKTHKMTDLTGITICVGNLEGTDIDRATLEETVKKIGAKPLQDSVKLDTTHFICTVGEGPHWKRAQDLNIPIVRPEWIDACEAERRLVGVRAYYLNADPKLRPPLHRPRDSTYGAQITADLSAASTASIGNSSTVGGASHGTEASGPNSPHDSFSAPRNGPADHISKHRRAVSEVQDSPFPPTPATSTPQTTVAPATNSSVATEPMIEEEEEEEKPEPEPKTAAADKGKTRELTDITNKSGNEFENPESKLKQQADGSRDTLILDKHAEKPVNENIVKDEPEEKNQEESNDLSSHVSESKAISAEESLEEKPIVKSVALDELDTIEPAASTELEKSLEASEAAESTESTDSVQPSVLTETKAEQETEQEKEEEQDEKDEVETKPEPIKDDTLASSNNLVTDLNDVSEDIEQPKKKEAHEPTFSPTKDEDDKKENDETIEKGEEEKVVEEEDKDKVEEKETDTKALPTSDSSATLSKKNGEDLDEVEL